MRDLRVMCPDETSKRSASRVKSQMHRTVELTRQRAECSSPGRERGPRMALLILAATPATLLMPSGPVAQLEGQQRMCR